MPASPDPEKRAAQLRNLRPDAATKHGVYSESKLKPIRDRFVESLDQQFGTVATDDEIYLAADRRAKLDVLHEWIDRRGLLADRRSGRPRAVLQLADRLQSAYERQIAAFVKRLPARVPSDPEPHFEVPIELTDEERVGLRADDEKIRADTAHRILERIRQAKERPSPEPASSKDGEDGEDGEEKLDLKVLTDQELDLIEEIIGEGDA